MTEVTPDPPETDPTSPQQPESKPRDIPSFADIKATPRTPSTLFAVNPEATRETLMVYLVQTLASVDVMVHNLVDLLDGSSRNALLGISNSVMLAEITANRVLDQIDPRE
ncbi:DUF6124 family protein [Pseudomonas frederiksbergensis]|uniref:DUF3077 domain-containing protein n=1 Tax=Pseudomonas frederiksbergensis TaxID=104087 RepID=A0A423KI07_9PSED|nr:DUF6124 family protein [Pseudomonas frederiksbergensis]RON52794.1 hypothetical protein BK666_01465 [Pseudomonas frederiksbergensis]RON56820.1 hypothetical protein BK667_05160 [Pseudomonas frederiksbergensis]